jgi:hypothetical protein
MPRYRVTCSARATIRETWIVEADSPEQARERMSEGDCGFEFVRDEVVGDEEEREVTAVEPLAEGESA